MDNNIISLYVCAKVCEIISFSCFQVIAAEGEQKASRALREAANVIAESSSALQVIFHAMSCYYIFGAYSHYEDS